MTFSAVFAALGLSGIVPFVHTTIRMGFVDAVYIGQIGWLGLMAFLYLLGKNNLSVGSNFINLPRTERCA